MTDLKRCLLIAPQPWFAWRGSPIRVDYNARALAAAGWQVDLVVMPAGLERRLDGVFVHRPANPLRVRDLPIGPSPQKAFLDVLLWTKAWRVARQRRPLVVHGIEEAGAMAVWIARSLGCRSIFEKHSDPASYRQGLMRNLVMWAYARVERWTLRHADLVIVTGPALAEQARAAGTRLVHHIPDIPSSLIDPDPARAAQIRREWCAAPDEVWAMYAGSFAVYQGIDLLFESIVHAARSDPRLRFAIIGGTDSEIAQRRAALSHAGVVEKVRFLGHVHPDELPHYLAAADILLSPRLAGRNTPLKLLDYLKAGRAIVATDTEANRLILSDDVAFFVPPDPKSFAEGIVALARDPSQRAALGERGRNLILEHYNYHRFSQKLLACYAEAMSSHVRGGEVSENRSVEEPSRCGTSRS